jgi:deoxyribonucleoside regulator
LLWKSGFLNKNDTVKLKEAGAVGAICGRFFDGNGQECWNEQDDRTIGLTLDEFRKIKHQIAVGVGEGKVAGIFGALKGRLLNVLVKDEDTANRLLARSL